MDILFAPLGLFAWLWWQASLGVKLLSIIAAVAFVAVAIGLVLAWDALWCRMFGGER